jgi:chromosome segregation ATPase
MVFDGKETKKLTEPINFVVEALTPADLPEANAKDAEEFRKQVVAQEQKFRKFSKRLDKARRVVEEAKTSVSQSLSEPGTLLAELPGLESELESIQKSLRGNPLAVERMIEGIPSPASRLQSLFAVMESVQGPSKTQKEQLEILRKEISEQAVKIDRLFAERVTPLVKKLEGVGIELRAMEE